jgi:hypothetical protein
MAGVDATQSAGPDSSLCVRTNRSESLVFSAFLRLEAAVVTRRPPKFSTGLLALCGVLGIVRLVAANALPARESAALREEGSSRSSAPLFGIGRGERDARTHVAFDTPKGIVWASVHVVVDRTATTGLNFFALQVDFRNGTWAHGGLQDVDHLDGKGGPRMRQVNWGGLVDRGGGNADYDLMNDRADLEKIQNPAIGQQLGAYPSKNGVEYEYRVERVPQ